MTNGFDRNKTVKCRCKTIREISESTS